MLAGFGITSFGSSAFGSSAFAKKSSVQSLHTDGDDPPSRLGMEYQRD